MKFSTSTVLSLVVGSASAFAPVQQPRHNSRGLFASVEVKETVQVETPAASVPLPVEKKLDLAMPTAESSSSTSSSSASSNSKYQIQPGRYDPEAKSVAIPFLVRPPALDGSHAGDFGFDPLGLTESQDFYAMQEAELRHARLAMLAVVGWPMSELLAPDWMLQNNGCAPSVLNGFNPITFLATLVIFGGLGFFEYKTALRSNDTPMGRQHKKDMEQVWKWGVAGDYNFDPLNLYSSIGDDAIARKGLREVEISHGRSAMLGITAFAIWEKLTGHAIVENSMFFHPNLLLPALTAAYFAFNSVYELEESDTFVRFEVSSEGQARLENLKMSIPTVDAEKNKAATEAAMNAAEKAKDFLQKLPESIEKLQDKYMNDNTYLGDK